MVNVAISYAVLQALKSKKYMRLIYAAEVRESSYVFLCGFDRHSFGYSYFLFARLSLGILSQVILFLSHPTTSANVSNFTKAIPQTSNYPCEC